MQVSNLKSDQSNGLPAIKKIRGLIRCYHEHGLYYTADRLLTHLHITPERDYAFYSALPPEKYPRELKRWYRNVTGEKLNLKNPKTYNEKIQWMKLYDSTPLKTRLADKYLVRDWIKEKIGDEYLVPLLGVWDRFDEIDFDKLPDQFVLKANHGSGWNIIVKDKSTFDIEEARKKFDVWMHTNYAFLYGFELHYMNIIPKIVCEEMIEDNIVDYRVFCFDGVPAFIKVTQHNPQSKGGYDSGLYYPNWQKCEFKVIQEYGELEMPKPDHLEKLIELAKTLSNGFSFVRVDFYIVDKKIYFSEMTFTPNSGCARFDNKDTSLKFGKMIKLRRTRLELWKKKD